MTDHLHTGKRGEQLAQEHLRSLGYRIQHVNWRFLHLEIDIVALDGDLLVICEVKTRGTDAFGEPETFVSKSKQQNLIRAAGHYLEQLNLENEVRFDVVAVTEHQGEVAIKHIPGAFQAFAP